MIQSKLKIFPDKFQTKAIKKRKSVSGWTNFNSNLSSTWARQINSSPFQYGLQNNTSKDKFLKISQNMCSALSV